MASFTNRQLLEVAGWKRDPVAMVFEGPGGFRMAEETVADTAKDIIHSVIRADRTKAEQRAVPQQPIYSSTARSPLSHYPTDPKDKGVGVRNNFIENVSDGLAYDGTNWVNIDPNQSRTKPEPEFSHYDKLAMRVHVKRGESFGFDFLHIVEGPSLIFVMIVHGDEATILEDDKNLYPSDSLVAKFHLTKSSLTS